ncbi:hypothetical protein, partial [Pedobacter hartonius]
MTKEIKNGDTAYFYVPLTAKAMNTSSRKDIKISVQNISKFLLLRRLDGDQNFYIESFVGYKKSVDDSVKFSSGFSGNLTLYNLVSNEEYVYEYNKGKFKPNNKFADKALKSSNILNTQSCSYIEVCSWTRSCSEGLTVTVTESPSSQTPYAFACPPPTNIPGCGQGGWRKSDSYLKTNCSGSGQLPPPPVPPGTIGGGSGGGTGSEGESSQTPVPADTNVAKIALYCS